MSESTEGTTLLNPQAVIGDNVPDWGAEESGRLAREFAEFDRAVTDVLAESRTLPPTVEDEPTASAYTAIIGREKDLDDQLEKLRVGEGLPHMRKKDAVDGHFFRLRERLFKRKKTDQPGGGDVLMARLHAYNQRREDEERQRRLETERVAREAEERLRREREALERQQREAEAKAARARNETNKAAAEQAARDAAVAADAIRASEDAARDTRQQAQAAAAAKPADLVRERHDSGAMNTMARVGYAEITDEMLLDPVALWPFVKTDHKLLALQQWAKITQHRQQMKGAVVGFRNETKVRR